MRIEHFAPLAYGGLVLALSAGMIVAGRKAIRRIRGLGREDPATLRRLGMIRFGTASIVLLGLFLSVVLLMIQVDFWVGLFGPGDDVIGVFAFLLSLCWFFNAWALDRLSRPWRFERETNGSG